MNTNSRLFTQEYSTAVGIERPRSVKKVCCIGLNKDTGGKIINICWSSTHAFLTFNKHVLAGANISR
jgi:hypothetical protein